MSRHSLTSIHAKGGDVPRASYFAPDDRTGDWIGLTINGANVQLIAFEDGHVVTRVDARHHADAAIHLTVEQAEALRDSLNEALAKVERKVAAA